jgi:hypothetical protein
VRWRRRGLILPADSSRATGAESWAALPFALPQDGRQARVLFSRRDAANRSHIHGCTLDLASLTVDPTTVTDPLLSPGPLGRFDDSGCSMSCLVPHRGRLYLYYTGWTRGVTVPFHLSIGLAISDDDGRTFRRHSPAPLLDRHPVDPYLCASPCVLVEGDSWRMWYVSGVGWEAQPVGSPRHYYLIKYAESRDGLRWRRDGRVCIDFRNREEHAIGRPCVLRDGAGYRMWYCQRGTSYRIGYAESTDGLDWERRDEEAGMAPPASGWDAEMQAYPMVFHDGARLVMLYNGNGYGATGFGCATADQP